MPRNRADVDREAKVEEIVDAAAAVLDRGGYEALSLSAVARELGLARGAIYWYFPSSDDLFAAAVDKVFADALSDPPRSAGLVEQISWAVDRLAGLRGLYLALHARSHASASAGAVEAAIQDGLRTRLRDSVARHVDADRVRPVSEALGIFVEGLLVHRLPDEERTALLELVVGRLLEQS